jgi:predicted kinase
MTCRQKLSPVKSYKVGGVTYPRHVSDTHLELAQLLRDNLDEWLKGVHPMTSRGARKIYAEEITDQAFDALHDLAMDIDATPEEDY